MSKGSQQDWQHLGKYELRERLGRGGIAEVWKAFDPQLERYVAIKVLHADLQADPEFNTRFTREAKVIASLHHPNIVGIYDFQISHPPQSHAPTAYMVMEYIEGQTLAHYIRSTSREGEFPPPMHIVHLFLSISKAVDYAHQQGMIHRDIKPANILLDQRNTAFNPMGEPVLTDFWHCKAPGC
jgi:eukaryotic-like serine/threonine-protein kinase